MDYSLVTDENVDEITISYSQFSTRKSYYDYRRELKSSGLFINSEQRDNGKATWYRISKLDLDNCQKLAHKNTIVVMDDVHYTNPNFFNVGPNKAWLGMVSQGKIKEIGHEEYGPGRGLSWGYYVN